MYFVAADRVPSSNPLSSRVIVIGAGGVGLYAASQLAARGRDVVVIEAGDSHLGSFASESYTCVGRAHSGIRIGRSRNLGGTTSLWGGQLVEFQRYDFEAKSWMPGAKWPVSYDEIAPYYQPTYLNLGIPQKLIRDEDVWRGVSPRPELGSEFEVFFTRWLKIPNFAEMFAQQIHSDERMSVLVGHTAVGFRGSGNRVEAVRVEDGHGNSHWLEGGTVILAAGTIENARLLLHTAQDKSWDVPWRGNDNVGRYFQDHLGGRIGTFHPLDKRGFFKMFGNVIYAGYKFQPKVRMLDEVLRQNRTHNIQMFFAFESELSEHMVYLKQFLRAALYNRKISGVRDMARNLYATARYLPPLMWKYVWDHRVFVPSSSKIFASVQAEHEPLADSRISLHEHETDSYGISRAILDWRVSGNELKSLRDFALQIRDALQTAGVGQLKIDEDLLALNPEFYSKLGDTYHQSGGARMAASSDEGVVDKNLRVFGTENLYVAGASVFPTTSNANVTFTALAFTTRLVEHLLQVGGVREISHSLAAS